MCGFRGLGVSRPNHGYGQYRIGLEVYRYCYSDLVSGASRRPSPKAVINLILQCPLRRIAVMPCYAMQLKPSHRGSLAGSVHRRKSNVCSKLTLTYSSAPAHKFLP